MSLKSWLQSANKLANQGFSKQQVIDKIGDPPGKITSNGKGGWQKRTGNLNRQRKRRRNFDKTSTDLAYSEVQKSNNSKRQINREAKMYGLETMQTEHLADQDDAKSISAGAPGDPTNKLDVKTSDARFKDSVKQKLGKKGFAVVNNAAQESVKAIPKKFFDSIADPNTLPGIDIKTPADLDNVDAELQRSSSFSHGLNAMSNIFSKVLDRAEMAHDLFTFGRDGEELVNSAAEVVPGLKANPENDLGKKMSDAYQTGSDINFEANGLTTM